MQPSKKSMIRIFGLLTVLFLITGGYLLKIAVVDSDTMITNSYNPRVNAEDHSIRRGDIKDINGNVLAYSQKEGDTYVRYYNDGENCAHVLGYTGMGKAGVEASQNFTLENISHEISQRLSAFLTGNEVVGNSVVLTIDSYLQEIATNLLGNNKGAVVVTEVSTGRIVCMVSKPNYDPQTIADDWETLRQDENSPILNRATQGLYPPGSTFKIITAVAAMRHMSDWQSFTYTCTGEETFPDKVIHCFNEKAHGEVDMQEAFAQSCNCYFAALADKMGNEALAETAQQMGFGQKSIFDMPSSTSSFALTADSTESELVETSIGQGKTLVTPLFMANLVSAIANGGTAMQPYIVDHVEDENGETISTHLPQMGETLFSQEEVEQLRSMMIGVVETGTGTQADSDYFQVAGKTGTAENEGENDHLWFVGFAPAEDPQYAVAVIAENARGGNHPSVIARKMLYNAIYPEDR